MNLHDVSQAAIPLTYQRLGVVLAPDDSPYEAEGVLNPAVVRDRSGHLLLFPRMVAAGNVSRIGICRGGENNPIDITRLGVVFEPDEEYERRTAPGGYGCEDPRVTFIPRLDLFAMAYTAFGPHGPRIAIATSHDAYTWTRHGRIVFADDELNHVPNKDAAFFPEPVLSPSGVPSFALYHRPMLHESINGQAPISFILALPASKREVTCIGYIPVEQVLRGEAQALCSIAESTRVLEVGETWGRLKNGCGTPPLRTPAGWLSIFHGVDAREHRNAPSTLYYRAGLVIHDLERPDRVVYRSSDPFLAPETPAERYGVVDDVVFPTGLDELGGGSYHLYYGAGDARISLARLEIGGARLTTRRKRGSGSASPGSAGKCPGAPEPMGLSS